VRPVSTRSGSAAIETAAGEYVGAASLGDERGPGGVVDGGLAALGGETRVRVAGAAPPVGTQR
jgi:hypothetical protein